MKKLLVLVVASIFTLGAFAQENKEQPTQEKDKSYQKDKMGDKKMKKGIWMKDGKLMMMKDGKKAVMDKEMTLSDGSKVMTDGKVMMKDGTTKMMKEGESIGMDGKMMMNKSKEGMPKKEGQNL